MTAILTGTSDLFDVGTRQLESHHEMALEQVDGTKNIFRARVVDQLEIDRLFHAGEINKHQYAMAERLFDLAVKAGCYVRGINISELIMSGGPPTGVDVGSVVGLRALAFTRACRAIRQKAGEGTAKWVCAVVVDNRKAERPEELTALRMGLNALREHWEPRVRRDPRQRIAAAVAPNTG